MTGLITSYQPKLDKTRITRYNIMDRRTERTDRVCDNCTGGLTSLDNGFGQPTYCERCTAGLGLAMASVAMRMMCLAVGEVKRMEKAQAEGRGDNRFSLALRDENEKFAAQLAVEHDRLEILYISLGGYRATAAAR